MAAFFKICMERFSTTLQKVLEIVEIISNEFEIVCK